MMNTKKMKKSVAVLALVTGMLVVCGGFAASNLIGAAMPAYTPETLEYATDLYAELGQYDPIEDSRVELRESVMAQNMFMWPVEGHTRITSMFGTMTNPLSGYEEFHTGISIPAPEGTPVLAAKDGYVAMITRVFSLPDEEWGEASMVIEHGGERNYSTLYRNLAAIHVEEGQFVRQGEHIADVGSYGTGAFLHFELRIGERPIDPLPFLGVESYDWFDRSSGYTNRREHAPVEVRTDFPVYVIEHTERGISFELMHFYFEEYPKAQSVTFDNAAIIAADAIYAEFGVCIDGLSGHMLFVDNEYAQVQFWSGFIRCEESTSHSFADELFHFVISATTGEVISLYMNTVETPFHV